MLGKISGSTFTSKKRSDSLSWDLRPQESDSCVYRFPPITLLQPGSWGCNPENQSTFQALSSPSPASTDFQMGLFSWCAMQLFNTVVQWERDAILPTPGDKSLQLLSSSVLLSTSALHFPGFLLQVHIAPYPSAILQPSIMDLPMLHDQDKPESASTSIMVWQWG